MDQLDEQERGFAQTRLPWIAAGASLVLYLVTVSTWVRLDSLAVTAKIAGWDWTPLLHGPVHFLVTYPFRWLPASIQPLALNLLSGVMAAAVIGLLVRAVSLLPYDRTREARIRERHDLGLLTTPLAWVGPAFAAGLLALQLSFWEHATAATSEMLDLLLFAYLVHCLVEYRVSERESWLLRLALVYGLAVTNNYAMIAFFPCFLVAVVWLKGVDFFNLSFLGRMTCWGAAGLLPYLVLPLAAVLSDGASEVGFWGYLRSVLASQKSALSAFPPYAILLIALSSLVPVLVLAVRWPAGEGETSRAGVVMAAFITRVIHLAMLVAAVSVFYDPPWSARELGFGLALLPFYFLAALAGGYYLGYLLLVFREPKRSHHRVTPNERLLNRTTTGVALAASAAVVGVLAWRNFPTIRGNDGRLVYELVSLHARSLPAEGAYVISDQSADLLLLEAALARQGSPGRHVLLASQLMPYRLYHRELERQYQNRWPHLPEYDGDEEALTSGFLSRLVQDLARSNRVFYLHPSMGYYFELLELRPKGLVYELLPRPTNELGAVAFEPAEITANEQFWDGLTPFLDRVPARTRNSPAQVRFVTQTCARALNTWGVVLQRQGQIEPAGKRFEQALRLNPDNMAARLSKSFNDELRQGKIPPLDAPFPAGVDAERRDLDQLLIEDGPFDHPRANYVLGEVYVRNSLFRQALIEFERLQRLMPQEARLALWTQAMTAMVRFGLGDAAAAEAQALKLAETHPKEDLVLETLTQIYLGTGRMTEALGTIEKQLQLEPNNVRALLNKAAIHIHLKDYTGAIAPLNTLLGQQPENTPALMNRAIANLQSGQLDAAARDYESLRKLMPEYHAVYFGLGEIAFRKKDNAAALESYEDYLKFGKKGSDEYKSIEARVQQLRSGAP